MVGQQILVLFIEVRVLVPQPTRASSKIASLKNMNNNIEILKYKVNFLEINTKD
jgi:hypothetical protein